MKTYPCKVITLCTIALAACLQSFAQTATPAAAKAVVSKPNDTLAVRLNNKLYYTITDYNHWRVNDDGKVVFTTLNPNDTSPDIALDYIGSKPSLVKRLHKGDTIQNCLVGEIKLSFSDFMDKTQKKNAAQNVCSRKLIFVNCVFSRILADTSESLIEDDSKEKKKLNFTQDIEFLNCNFAKGLELSQCVFQKNFIISGQITSPFASAIDNCEFHGMTYIYSTPDYNKGCSTFKIGACTFYGPCIFSVVDNDKTRITIQRCKFNDVLSFGKSLPLTLYKRFHAEPFKNYVAHVQSYYNAYTKFLENKFTKEYYLRTDTIESFLPIQHVIYNMDIVHCKIKIFDISNASMTDCSLEDVSILKCIDVTNTSFNYSSSYDGKQALEDIDFPNMNGIMYASYKTFSPEAFKLNIYMQKILIHPLVHNFYDSTTDFNQDNSNFYNMIEDYAAKRVPNQDMITSLKARFEHEKAYWARQYHAAHIGHSEGFGDFIGSLLQWTLSWFLEMTVANGYKGELRFVLWVLFLILLFTTIYYIKHKDAAIDYLNAKFNKDELDSYETLKVYKSFNGFRDYMRCLWFSCMVFVDPRLPISFFNLRSGLFGLVLAEWLCGLTAIALFVAFLASNYPFIHTLIGI